MSPLSVAILLLVAAYLVGAIPFGYVVGRARGVNLFAAGSGNIGATNAARVLGPAYGGLVFVLDFLKGVVPVATVPRPNTRTGTFSVTAATVTPTGRWKTKA